MKNKINSRVVFMKTIGILFIFQCFLFVPISFANDVIVIANKDVKTTSITKYMLKNIFLGKAIEWEDGKRIVIATLKTGKVHKQFLKKYVGKTKSQYKMYYKRLLYSGKGKMLKAFRSQESLISYVANTDGAVGYVSSDADTENVQIIKIK